MLSWNTVSPETKLAALLEAWPHLAGVLTELSPAFRALDNPLLRRTFARAASLEQVAEAAEVPIGVLLEALQAAIRAPGRPVPRTTRQHRPAPPPPWTRRIPYARLDPRIDVERGVHPLPSVLAEVERLPQGETLELLTPLVPAPLVALLARKGYETSSELDEVRGFARTVIRRRQRASPPSSTSDVPDEPGPERTERRRRDPS